MARVPTWVELRLDATELAQLQRECYRSVHHMLDNSIPELDRKLLRLRQSTNGRDRLQELEKRFQALSTKSFAKDTQQNVKLDTRPLPKSPINQANIAREISPELPRPTNHGHQAVRQLFSDEHTLKPAIKKSNSHPMNGFYPRQASPCKPVYEEIDKEEPEEEYFKFHGCNRLTNNPERSSTPEPELRNTTMRAQPVRQPQRSKPQTNGFHRKLGAQPEPVYEHIEPTIDELEHLKPPPLPLSHYLKLNRPDVVEAANRRVAYLRRSAERRKLNASAKTINALDQIRAASRTSSNRGSSSVRSSLRGMTRSSTGPNLSQIRCKLSEQEMKRLTAKTYNRLPEVKKQRVQEVTKHLKVQNYKNKIEYGRRLLENRRRGIINYPLKGHHDESSVMSSLEESLTDSYGERSADGGKFDQYY